MAFQAWPWRVVSEFMFSADLVSPGECTTLVRTDQAELRARRPVMGSYQRPSRVASSTWQDAEWRRTRAHLCRQVRHISRCWPDTRITFQGNQDVMNCVSKTPLATCSASPAPRRLPERSMTSLTRFDPNARYEFSNRGSSPASICDAPAGVGAIQQMAGFRGSEFMKRPITQA
jgi:hypothetical protein